MPRNAWVAASVAAAAPVAVEAPGGLPQDSTDVAFAAAWPATVPSLDPAPELDEHAASTSTEAATTASIRRPERDEDMIRMGTPSQSALDEPLNPKLKFSPRPGGCTRESERRCSTFRRT